jgi:hypothetical protein
MHIDTQYVYVLFTLIYVRIRMCIYIYCMDAVLTVLYKIDYICISNVCMCISLFPKLVSMELMGPAHTHT